MRIPLIIVAMVAVSIDCCAFAEPPDRIQAPAEKRGLVAKLDARQAAATDAMLKLASDRFASKQLWTDELLFHDYRIQRNALDDTCCLVDGQNERLATGDFAKCQAALGEIKRARKLPAMSGRVVLVLHGLIRTRNSSDGMAKYLEQKGRYTALTFGYASTRDDIATHARSLAGVIEHLEGVTEINLVAHSLGNLVIRHYLADHTDAITGRKPDPRIKRIVMIGAPNNGAQMAELFLRNRFSEAVIGEPGQALARGWDELNKQLIVPECEFGVIAGGRNDENGYNPLLPGDDDLIVSVEETRLPGARDFIVLPAVHARMMENPDVQEATLRFLKRGYFVSEKRRQPIAK